MSEREIPCSLRAVKTMVAVSSPTRHSAIRVWRRCCETERPLAKTVLELTTLTTRVWPVVPGFNWSTFLNSGFLSAGFALLCCCSDGGDGGGGSGVAMMISQTLTLILIHNPNLQNKKLVRMFSLSLLSIPFSLPWVLVFIFDQILVLGLGSDPTLRVQCTQLLYLGAPVPLWLSTLIYCYYFSSCFWENYILLE